MKRRLLLLAVMMAAVLSLSPMLSFAVEDDAGGANGMQAAPATEGASEGEGAVPGGATEADSPEVEGADASGELGDVEDPVDETGKKLAAVEDDPDLQIGEEDAEETVLEAQTSDDPAGSEEEDEELAAQATSTITAIYLTYAAPAAGAAAPATVNMSVEPAGAVAATTLGVQWLVAAKYENGQMYDLEDQEIKLAAGDAFQAGYIYYPIFSVPTLNDGYRLDDTTEVYVNGIEVGTYTSYPRPGSMPGYYHGPLVEGATTPITGYNLIVDEPVAGKASDTTATVTFTTAGGTVDGTQDVSVTWMEYSSPDRTNAPDAYSTTTFQAGKYYWVSDLYVTNWSNYTYSAGVFQALPTGYYYDIIEDGTFTVNVNGAAQAFFGPLEAVGNYELTYTYDDANHTATVTGFTGDAGGSLEIPATTTKEGVDYTVTAIKAYAFSGKTAFTGSLSIPNTVTSIGNGAFNGCSNLSGTLTIPGSVTSVGDSAFQSCSKFAALEFASGEGVLTIGTCAFCRCSGLTGTLTIPARMTSIGTEAFEYCSALTGLAFAANSQLTTISQKAFYECRGLTGDLTLPDSVTTIEREAFSYCSSFNGTLTLPSNVTTIGREAFSQDKFTGDLVVPSTLTSYDGAFYHAGTFHNVTLAEGLTTIGKSAFTGAGITGTLAMPSTVTTIPESAFWACKYEGSLTIPATVTTIEKDAFESFGVEGKTGTLTFAEGSTLTTIGESAFEDSCFSGTLVLPNSLTSIGERAFCDAEYLTGLVLPENDAFTTIPKMAFSTSNTSGWGYYTMGLTGTVVIPANVTTIGERAFQDTRSLQNLSFASGSKLATIGDYAFWHCGLGASNPGGLVLPNSLTTIGNNAFHYCGFTGDLIIPDSVTSMGERVFYQCSGFNGTLHLPENSSFTTVPEGTFDQCANIVGPLVLPSNVKTIGPSAFNGCAKLTATITGSDNVLNGVESIGDYAFYYCKALTGTLTIPSSVSYLGASSFANQLGITTVEMHQTDTVLRDGLFSSCYDLVSVGEIPATVTEFGDEVFENCYALECDGGSFAIPEGVTTVGSEVFWDCRKLTGTVTIPSTVTSLNGKALWLSHFTTIVNNCDQTLDASYVAGSNEHIEDGTGQVNVIGKGTYTRVPGASGADLSGATVTGIADKTYTGKAQTQSPTVVVNGTTLTSGTDYTLSYKNNVNAGTATVTISGAGSYTGSIDKTFTINKAANTLKASGKTAKVKAKKVKKKAQKLAVGKVVKFTSAGQGTLTYAKKKGSKKIAIDKKTGKVTVKKGLKKGTYKVKAIITAAGDANHKAASVPVTFKVKVK